MASRTDEFLSHPDEMQLPIYAAVLLHKIFRNTVFIKWGVTGWNVAQNDSYNLGMNTVV